MGYYNCTVKILAFMQGRSQKFVQDGALYEKLMRHSFDHFTIYLNDHFMTTSLSSLNIGGPIYLNEHFMKN